MNSNKMIRLIGAEGIAYIQRVMLKEAGYMRVIAKTLPNDKEALRKPGLETADNLEYYVACLITLKDGGEIDFDPPHKKSSRDRGS